MKTILIVDDQERIRFLYTERLTKEGYHVLNAADAVQANEVLKHKKIDLMLLDIKMPGVNGLDLYAVKEFFYPGVKVIVSSVYPADDQKWIINNADDYFDKSEGLKVLIEKVNYHLSHSELRKKIVIIDDEIKVRVLFSAFLAKAGYDSIGFSDNQAALRYLRKTAQRIDLLILDLIMPKVEGSYFFEIMKTKHPDVKILIASNYPLDTQKFIIFDADDYFEKTEGKAVLLEKVKHLIGSPTRRNLLSKEVHHEST